MNVTPSSRSSFLAGIGIWCLMWAALFKVDDIAAVGGLKRWLNLERCLTWIRKHKSTSLLGTELFNYATHGISDPLAVTFALGGTLTNFFVIYVLLPLREKAKRGAALLNL